MIEQLWISEDDRRLAVVDEDGNVTIIDTHATYPDGVSFECMRAEDALVDLRDGTWDAMPVDTAWIPVEQA